MFSEFRVKTGQVTLISTELQNVQWISSAVQGRTGDVTCHRSYCGTQIREQWTRKVGEEPMTDLF